MYTHEDAISDGRADYRAMHPPKSTDWATETADKLVALTESVMRVQDTDAANALECVLSSTCAGPRAIALAQAALGIKTREIEKIPF